MAVKLLYNAIQQFADGNGLPYSGAKLFFYAAGSSTKQTTYTESTGTTPNTNPVVLDSAGRIPQPVWLTTGTPYKIVLAPSTDTDPPVSPIWTLDNVSGINDTTTSFDQWVSGPAPTYISATSFTLVGDQTSTFQPGRRLKTTNSGGTVYSTILTSAFAAVTTITVLNDSGSLDSGLSAVSYGLLSKTNDSLPRDIFMTPAQTKGQIFGLTMSTAGASATMAIAAGVAVDSTGAAAMTLASAISKTTSAWAVGSAAGGLDTGAIANSTWYHFFLIKRLDTGVVDVLISLSPTGPTMPANYTLYRRIGSGLTNGSAQWVKFVQLGDEFLWDTMVLDINTGAASATAASYTLTVPSGVQVTALLRGTFTFIGSPGKGCLLSSLDEADIAPATGTGKVTFSNPVDSQYASGEIQVRTNTSKQIRVRCTDNASNLNVSTRGWIDRRGRDA